MNLINIKIDGNNIYMFLKATIVHSNQIKQTFNPVYLG